MVNLLGDLWQAGEPDWQSVLADPHVRLHLYGKAEPRPGRKMGHLTVLADSAEEAAQCASRSPAVTAVRGLRTNVRSKSGPRVSPPGFRPATGVFLVGKTAAEPKGLQPPLAIETAYVNPSRG